MAPAPANSAKNDKNWCVLLACFMRSPKNSVAIKLTCMHSDWSELPSISRMHVAAAAACICGFTGLAQVSTHSQRYCILHDSVIFGRASVASNVAYQSCAGSHGKHLHLRACAHCIESLFRETQCFIWGESLRTSAR